MVTVMGNRPRSWSWSRELKSPPLSLHFLHDQLFGHEVVMLIVMDIVMFSVSVYAVLRTCTFFMIRIMSIHHYCNGQVTDGVVVMIYGSDVL
jgi:hypothetical protein